MGREEGVVRSAIQRIGVFRVAKIQCPGCGVGKDRIAVNCDTWKNTFQVECEACQSRGPKTFSPVEAMEAWIN
ncbi:hypothetical protein KAR91_09755 [Candidatus Pacearchaeota archaeon]|nr:hypothetical protein [Candidatus Pacearchaeota archaeon]